MVFIPLRDREDKLKRKDDLKLRGFSVEFFNFVNMVHCPDHDFPTLKGKGPFLLGQL